MYIGAMLMKRTNFFVAPEHMKELEEVARRKGLKVAQLVRLAISEYLDRERDKQFERSALSKSSEKE